MSMNKKDVIKYGFYGLIAGVITVILDMVPGGHYESFWFFGFASGSFGIWGICAIIIMLQNDTAKKISYCMLSFMTMMCISYYVLEGIIASITSYQTIQSMSSYERVLMGFDKEFIWLEFNWHALVMWLIISIFCTVWTYLTIKFKHKKSLYYCMISAPLIVVFLEGITFAVIFFSGYQGFIPFLCNLLGFIWCSYAIYNKDRVLEC